MKKIIVAILLLASCLMLGQFTALATEGGSSYYFPGASTTFAPAIPPAPGFTMANQMLFYSGDAGKAVLGGQVRLDMKDKAFYNYVGGFYTFDKPVFGNKKLQLGLAVPIGNNDLTVSASTAHHFAGRSDRHTALGDTVLTAALYWKDGDCHYKLTESVFAPTGSYSTDNLINIGRNYWGFDTSLAMTWLNVKTGAEFSITPGIMFNTKNSATDYKSGNEFHVDFALNHHYFKENLAIGLQGYYYKQLSADSGSGARLGSFKGEAFGIGPAILWKPKAYKGDLVVVAKWLHDVHETNRLSGDYGQLTVGYKF